MRPTPTQNALRPRGALFRLTCGMLAVALALPAATGSLAAARADAASRHAGLARAALATARDQLGALGLRPGSDLSLRHGFTNPQGRTVLHAAQTYRGVRVWGATAIVHAEPWGETKLLKRGLMPDAMPAGSAKISAGQAEQIALKAFGAAPGTRVRSSAELVVFPSRFFGQVQLVWDPRSSQYTLNRRATPMSQAPKDEYVWAYDVKALSRDRRDGLKDMSYVVDATTGAILRASSGIRTLEVTAPPALKDSDVPVKGVGLSQYNGRVTLDSIRRADGTYALIDRTRGSKWNPYLHDAYMDYETYTQIMDEDGKPISIIGLQSLTELHEADSWAPKVADQWLVGNRTNTWGDGRQFQMWPYGTEMSANGQTAAVDAHFGMAQTWDFYKNLFGRDGIDNQGTSPISQVHTLAWYGYYYDNAFWSDQVFGMFYSDGTYNTGVDPFTGGPVPGYEGGFNSLTAIDIIGHEMTHGVTSHTAGLIYEGESGGINEATSDIFGELVQGYSKRLPGVDGVVPAQGIDWEVGTQVSPLGQALRSMRRPSLDGYSADNWYAGIRYLDVHFSSGPGNRAFYFLAQGASATPGAVDHSLYLPGGMSGIGNDKAARIWYKTLTEYLTMESDYADLRVSAIEAATALYGADSTEVKAVRNAFSAINVGEADGQPPRVRISLPIVHPPGTPLNGGASTEGFFARMPIVGMGTTVQLGALVENTTDQRVVWATNGRPGNLGSPGFRRYGGLATPDGRWTPPNEAGWHAMTVTSQADPLQYAEGVVWVVNADADGDTEFDAIDMGAVALSWGLNGWVKSSHGIVGDGFTDSMDVTAILEALRNAVSFN